MAWPSRATMFEPGRPVHYVPESTNVHCDRMKERLDSTRSIFASHGRKPNILPVFDTNPFELNAVSDRHGAKRPRVNDDQSRNQNSLHGTIEDGSLSISLQESQELMKNVREQFETMVEAKLALVKSDLAASLQREQVKRDQLSARLAAQEITIAQQRTMIVQLCGQREQQESHEKKLAAHETYIETLQSRMTSFGDAVSGLSSNVDSITLQLRNGSTVSHEAIKDVLKEVMEDIKKRMDQQSSKISAIRSDHERIIADIAKKFPPDLDRRLISLEEQFQHNGSTVSLPKASVASPIYIDLTTARGSVQNTGFRSKGDLPQIKHDGKVYLAPQCMKGVPVEKIGPGHAYWDDIWVLPFVSVSFQNVEAEVLLIDPMRYCKKRWNDIYSRRSADDRYIHACKSLDKVYQLGDGNEALTKIGLGSILPPATRDEKLVAYWYEMMNQSLAMYYGELVKPSASTERQRVARL